MMKPVQTLAWAALLLAGNSAAAQDTDGSDAGDDAPANRL